MNMELPIVSYGHFNHAVDLCAVRPVPPAVMV